MLNTKILNTLFIEMFIFPDMSFCGILHLIFRQKMFTEA